MCKRLPNCKTYDELVGQLESRLNLPGTAQIGENLKLFYLDEDGDIICVSCDDDLQEAMHIFPDGRIKMALSNSGDDASAVLSGALNQSSMLDASSVTGMMSARSDVSETLPGQLGFGQAAAQQVEMQKMMQMNPHLMASQPF